MNIFKFLDYAIKSGARTAYVSKDEFHELLGSLSFCMNFAKPMPSIDDDGKYDDVDYLGKYKNALELWMDDDE